MQNIGQKNQIFLEFRGKTEIVGSHNFLCRKN